MQCFQGFLFGKMFKTLSISNKLVTRECSKKGDFRPPILYFVDGFNQDFYVELLGINPVCDIL